MDLRRQLEATLGGTYAIERELTGGGMSRVFVATELALGRKVVIKVLSHERSAGLSAERFARETKLAASLQQANIVPLLAAGEIEGGLPWYTMPYVEGESLRARLVRDAALPVAEVVDIVRDVARALAYAQSRGVVHRDIKPDNVLISGGAAVVTDFGIAKALWAARTTGENDQLSQVGVSVGTPAYMSPEQVAGDPDVDHRADIYALGCMMFELLSGHTPFPGRSSGRVLAAHVAEVPQNIAGLREDTPPALTALVMQCLEKEPANRPQSATDVLRALDLVTNAGNTTIPESLVGAPAMLRRALKWYALSFIAVLIISRAAMIVLGLPDWVFPATIGVMSLGLPAILFTGYVQRATLRALATTAPRTLQGSLKNYGPIANFAIRISAHVSWRRLTKAGVYALGAFVAVVALFMALRQFGIGPMGTLAARGTFAKRDSVIVADFKAAGADSALGGVLAEALRTGLGESDVVAVAPASRIAAALQRMQKPANSTIDLELARTIAGREGIRGVVDGTLTPLRAGYVVSVRLIAATSGDELATYHETVDTPKELIAAVDRAGRKLRERIGESFKSVRAAAPLEQVTTASLEALQKYTEGRRAMTIDLDAAKAVRLLREATTIDTTFAMAWRQLAITMTDGRIGTSAETQASFAKAYQFRDHLTEGERLAVIGYYFSTNGLHPDRARYVSTYEELSRNHAETPGVVNLLANQYVDRREYARAESTYRRAIAIEPGNRIPPINMIRAQIGLGAFDRARQSLADARTKFPGLARIDEFEALVLYNEGKLDSAANKLRVQFASSDLQVRSIAGAILFPETNLRGRFGEALKILAQVRAIDSARGATLPRLADSVDQAQIALWFQDKPDDAVKRLEAALARYPLASVPAIADRPYFRVAALFAMAGRADRARAILAQYDADAPDTVSKRLTRPDRENVLAWIAIAENKPMQAVALFRSADQLDDGPNRGCAVCAFALVGRAFDRANMPDSAIAAFEKFLKTPDAYRLTGDSWHRAFALRRLGELAEAKGDLPRAREYYAQFVELWKDADAPYQPRVAEVRAKLSKLGNSDRGKP